MACSGPLSERLPSSLFLCDIGKLASVYLLEWVSMLTGLSEAGGLGGFRPLNNLPEFVSAEKGLLYGKSRLWKRDLDKRRLNEGIRELSIYPVYASYKNITVNFKMILKGLCKVKPCICREQKL